VGPSGSKNRRRAGLACVHTALDDHSRLAYGEDLPDETAPTCAALLQRATAWFAAHGIVVERTCRELGISPRWTRPWQQLAGNDLVLPW